MLSRETLYRLNPSQLRYANGGVYTGESGRTVCHTACVTNCGVCGPGSESMGGLCTTMNECSDGCNTGGACTVSCQGSNDIGCG